MTIQATFSEELACFQDSDDSFLALLGNNENLDPPRLNVEDRVGDLALHEDGLALREVKDGLSGAYSGEKIFGLKLVARLLAHLGASFTRSPCRHGGVHLARLQQTTSSCKSVLRIKLPLDGFPQSGQQRNLLILPRPGQRVAGLRLKQDAMKRLSKSVQF